jgi:tRNA pseudouridine65 synthase
VDTPPAKAPPIEVLFQDEAIVVAAKPSGLLCHRSAESRDRVFLLQTLRNQLGCHLYPVHRLDRAASGAIAFALGSEEARLLQASLGDPGSRKEYLVLVRGETPAAWESTRPLKSDAGVVQDAHTIFEKVAGFSRLTLLRAVLRTGRRHQIRRHLAHEAHQVLGDSTYGKGRINAFFREEFGLPRLFLHSSILEFRHPLSGAPTVVRCPLPEDLRGFLARLPDVPADLVDGRI